MKTTNWSFFEWLWHSFFTIHIWDHMCIVKSTQPKGLSISATVDKCRYCSSERILIPGFKEIKPNLFERI